MIKVGLIKRKNGKYFLTSLGKVVYEVVSMIESALKDHWKLKAIDQLQAHINAEKRKKIIDTLLIDNQKIKEIII
jgi:predicted transcriptional regulator